MKYSNEIQKAQFDMQGLAIISGWAEVYICHHETREYLYASLDNVPFGGSVIADAYLDKPSLPEKSGTAVIRSIDEKTWVHTVDYRGETGYSTLTQQPVKIDFIGELPDNLTLLVPQTEFDKWDGAAWVTDIEAQNAAAIAEAVNNKARLLNEANEKISYLQDAVDIDVATESEAAALTEWKKYRVELNRINVNTAPDIHWPLKPE